MFLWSYRDVAVVLILCALYTYLLISGHYAAAKPWIDAVLLALIAFVLIRIWLK